MKKVNYQLKMQAIIDALPVDETPTLLLHACCAPCSAGMMAELAEHFKITVYFDNPNMDSATEYERRAQELARFLKSLPLKNAAQLVVAPYEPEIWQEAISGLEETPEGGKRCSACFALRLKRSAAYAQANGCDYMTTTLSVSPHKNSGRLNRIGSWWAKKYGVKFLYADFKKNDGYRRACQVADQYNLYRQDYCGCIYSKEEAAARRRAKAARIEE